MRVRGLQVSASAVDVTFSKCIVVKASKWQQVLKCLKWRRRVHDQVYLLYTEDKSRRCDCLHLTLPGHPGVYLGCCEVSMPWSILAKHLGYPLQDFQYLRSFRHLLTCDGYEAGPSFLRLKSQR